MWSSIFSKLRLSKQERYEKEWRVKASVRTWSWGPISVPPERAREQRSRKSMAKRHPCLTESSLPVSLTPGGRCFISIVVIGVCEIKKSSSIRSSHGRMNDGGMDAESRDYHNVPVENANLQPRRILPLFTPGIVII